MAGAIDTTASFSPDSAAGSDQVFNFTADDFDAPKPAADVGEASTAAIAADDSGDGATTPATGGDVEALLSLNSEPEGSADGESLASGSQTGAGAPQLPATDVATARIDAASGSGDGRIRSRQQAPKRSGGLLALFSDNGATQARQSGASLAEARRAPVVTTSRKEAKPRPVVATARATGSAGALPGVDRERALGVKAGGGNAEGSLYATRPVQLASAAGLARLAPNGLRTQTDNVEISCLKPALVRVLKQVERAYGKPVVVTSGYRNPPRNKRAGGAKNSLHMYCSAADIQIEGVSKWQLAETLRAMPGRGGVGTYCHTKSVHVDIGPERDWNWRCRR